MGGRAAIDLLGKRFGKLLITGRAYDKDGGGARWQCICDCGREINVWSSNLRRSYKNTFSCGCIKKSDKPHRQKDVTGQRFGRLVAMHILPRFRRGNRSWVCQCDCGKVKAVSCDRLVGGSTISCGCAANLGCKKAFRPKNIREKSLARDYVRKARENNANGSYTPSEINELYLKQGGKCANCLCRIGVNSFQRDHIIPLSRGGPNWISNIQLLCTRCNQRKYAKDPLEFARAEGRLL